MKLPRRLLFALALAFALLFGQQAAALHDLGHAVDRIAHKGSAPSSPCDQCFACAQLSGAVGTSLPAIPAVPLENAAPLERARSGFLAAPRLAFLSRGPPALL